MATVRQRVRKREFESQEEAPVFVFMPFLQGNSLNHCCLKETSIEADLLIFQSYKHASPLELYYINLTTP